MPTVRAKFRVNTVRQHKGTDGTVYQEEIQMGPVYSSDPASENRAFWTATPSGNLSMYVNNTAVFGRFQEGQEYYLDFTEVTPTGGTP